MVYNGLADFVQWTFVHDGSVLPDGFQADNNCNLLCLKSEDGRINSNVLQCTVIWSKRLQLFQSLTFINECAINSLFINLNNMQTTVQCVPSFLRF